MQDDNTNALLVERHDGEVVENLVFKGKISNIFLNRDKDLEISFEQTSAGVQKHVTIPIHDQIEE